MKSKKVLSLLLACAVTVSMGTTVFASTEDQIAAAQEQKQEAQAGLAQAQANISDLESKKQELESYLAELNSQYNELTDSISQLSIEAAEKEEELKNVKAQLEVAKQNAQDQYEAMKIRIQYMYEHGGSTMLEMLLSSDNLSDFMNQANNVATISTYDRNMLKKYEETQEAIKYIRDTFQKEFGKEMNLERISAPLFVEKSSGLNDDLNGVERPVQFDIAGVPGETIEVVHSLAKWKRMALYKYGFQPGEGLYTNTVSYTHLTLPTILRV